MKVVKFLKYHAVYGVGEIAGFDDDRADQLIASGVAEEYSGDASQDSAAPARGAAKKVAAEKPGKADGAATQDGGEGSAQGQAGGDASQGDQADGAVNAAAGDGAPPAQGQTA